MKQLFLERWQKFDQKEQSFLAVCGLLLSGFLLYAFLWLPIQQANQRLTNELPKKEAQYILMKLQAAEIEKNAINFI
jgi:type II secretory pathway component PulM